MDRLVDLALRTGRQVGPHISMLLAALEGAGLLPSELEAQVRAPSPPPRCCCSWWLRPAPLRRAGGCLAGMRTAVAMAYV